MPRMLKTKFACKDCGAPAEVARLAEGPDARCPPCIQRRRDSNRINWADWAADREVAAAREEEELRQFLIGYLKAVEERVRAARFALEAMRSAFPRELVRLVRIARGRARWGRNVLAQLEDFFDEAVAVAKSDRPMQVLEGGGELPVETIPPPRFTLIRQEKSE